MKHRQLDWPGCSNVRDLGGLPTADGCETRFGRVVRADNVHQLTQAGWEALARHGVRRIVDLRSSIEREAGLTSRAGAEIVHIPLLGELLTGDGRQEFLGPADVTGAVVQASLLRLDRHRVRFAETIVAMAEHGEGCVLVHCAVGKDRTGLIVALLLRLVGVDHETVAEDYALSEANLVSWRRSWLEEAVDAEHLEVRRRMAASPREAMLEVLRHLDEAEGGAEGYLVSAGATPDHVEAIRRRLLD